MELLKNAQTDSLTLCYTKDALLPYLDKQTAKHAAYATPFSILVIDVDKFKSFNDKHGHVFGDEVLKYFSSSLRLIIDDEECVVFRFGGDEFIVVFSNKASREAYKVAVNIEKNIGRRPFLFKGSAHRISFSGGIASCPVDGRDVKELLEKADKAMYHSKKHGLGRITQYDKMRFEFVNKIKNASIAVALIIVAFFITIRIFNITPRDILRKVRSIPQRIASLGSSHPVKVYLKSGATMEGTIARENDKEIIFKFGMFGGEGSAAVDKDDITYIDRDYKPRQ